MGMRDSMEMGGSMGMGDNIKGGNGPGRVGIYRY